MISFFLNGQVAQTDVAPDTPLLWVLRDVMGLTGTKYGCGAGLCGACTVHIDGLAVRSCVEPIEAVQSKAVVTIEGLGTPSKPHPLQVAWRDRNVSQCGYCQSGQIMSAAALLDSKPSPTLAEVKTAMNGNLCRCGCYPRIAAAIMAVAEGSTI
ncbi:MAG: (2Fe-2S)-binding protein [Aestuariivita sp.]|nr:(2Fe-2S)-binding protein [Aestuariivita sp.]MCY4348056.1 (2Fe-2S)-binding protein [Aestuariivita sp.]